MLENDEKNIYCFPAKFALHGVPIDTSHANLRSLQGKSWQNTKFFRSTTENDEELYNLFAKKKYFTQCSIRHAKCSFDNLSGRFCQKAGNFSSQCPKMMKKKFFPPFFYLQNDPLDTKIAISTFPCKDVWWKARRHNRSLSGNKKVKLFQKPVFLLFASSHTWNVAFQPCREVIPRRPKAMRSESKNSGKLRNFSKHFLSSSCFGHSICSLAKTK